jgi:hypothetical protein
MRETGSTPGRDRYVDLLRVLSLGVVVLGHWLMAVVAVGEDGVARAGNVLAVVPALQPATWLLQVMPVFFLVGGFSHAVAWASVRRRGGRYADFVRSRAGRLLRPTAAFAGVWLVVALGIEAAGADRGVLRLATRVVAQPLWFIGVYLGVVALAPMMLRLHRLAGRRAPLVPAALGAAAVAVDVARFAYDVPFVGFANVAFVWLAVHQAGFLYADGTPRRRDRRTGLVLTGAGLVATVALTASGGYPVSMVGVPGERVSNMSPPTVALLACAVLQIGLVLLARGPVTRWLRRVVAVAPAVDRGAARADGGAGDPVPPRRPAPAGPRAHRRRPAARAHPARRGRHAPVHPRRARRLGGRVRRRPRRAQRHPRRRAGDTAGVGAAPRRRRRPAGPDPPRAGPFAAGDVAAPGPRRGTGLRSWRCAALSPACAQSSPSCRARRSSGSSRRVP